MKNIPRILFHSLPLLPLAFGQYFIAVSVVLLVVLAYIKVHKLRLEIGEIKARGRSPEKSLTTALEFWQRLTFLQ